jgi:tripartite-type tricarboxylate transporter receptor subunit TctC
VLAPGGTPQPVVSRMNDELIRILERPDVKGKLESLGFDILAKSPADFRILLERDIKAFARVIADAKIRAN